jgi:hypothetical protein
MLRAGTQAAWTWARRALPCCPTPVAGRAAPVTATRRRVSSPPPPSPPPHSMPPAHSRSRCCGGCSGIENNFIAVRNMKGSALGNTLYAEYETGAPGQSWTRMKV